VDREQGSGGAVDAVEDEEEKEFREVLSHPVAFLHYSFHKFTKNLYAHLRRFVSLFHKKIALVRID